MVCYCTERRSLWLWSCVNILYPFWALIIGLGILGCVEDGIRPEIPPAAIKRQEKGVWPDR